MPHNPKKHFSLLSVILIAAFSAVLLYFTKLNILYSYLISLNSITFLIYGYDKYQAKRIGMRIPEIVLHLLTLIGGALGALLGQLIFRHKNKKMKFIVVFWAIVIVQVIVIFLLRGYIVELMKL